MDQYLKIVVREEIRFKPIKTGKGLIPRDRASAAKNIFDKALALPQGDEFEGCIENREGTYPGH
jgi:hypothetical protein